MKLEQMINGLMDAETKLSNATAMNSPLVISENMYRLAQYASALEKYLGDCEEEYEHEWGTLYKKAMEPNPESFDSKPMSATAAKQYADVMSADMKGNIKKLQRYVSSAWHVHMSCMARMKHLAESERGGI